MLTGRFVIRIVILIALIAHVGLMVIRVQRLRETAAQMRAIRAEIEATRQQLRSFTPRLRSEK